MLHTYKNTFIAFLLLLMAQFALGQQLTDVQYINKITAEVNRVGNSSWQYINASLQLKSSQEISSVLKSGLVNIETARKNLSALPPFKGDAALRDSALSYVTEGYRIMNEEFTRIDRLRDVSNNSYADMLAYVTAQQAANVKLNKQFARIKKEQENFAAKNNIQIVESEATKTTSRNVVTGLRIIDYYNRVYLVFFKSNKQEDGLIDALDKADTKGMESNQTVLRHFSEEGLSRLDTFSAFDGDTSLLHAARAALTFYLYEVNEQVPLLAEYFTSKTKFEKIKANYNAIPDDKHTQPQVDSYNKALEELKQKTKQYNEVNADLNKKRAGIIDAWNKTGNAFIIKHRPVNK